MTTLILACTLTACTPLSSTPVTLAPQPILSPTEVSTSEITPTTFALSPTPTPRATATPLPPRSGLCSPLEGITLGELSQPDLLKNPFNPPPAGEDGGHQGADFAYWSRGERNTMQGLPVLSVLDGRVAAALPLRQPYGNAVIIETSLNNLPPEWLSAAPVPTPAPTAQISASLYCPPGGEVETLSAGRFPEDYSLYLLYAHLDQPPSVQTGQAVACGQAIGKAGTTGNSVNVHLHLETRLGPSGASFSSIGHYDNAATNLEMSNYCVWRVSGLFQMFDPLRLLSLQP